MLVELVRVGDTGSVESFSSGNQGPESRSINLLNDIVGNAVASGVPPSGDLTSDSAAERERFRNHNAGTLLQLGEPLVTLAGPDVALVSVLQLELVCFGIGNFDRFEVMEKFDLLVEDLLFRVIPTEEIGF